MRPVTIMNRRKITLCTSNCAWFVTSWLAVVTNRRRKTLSTTLKAFANSSPGFALKPWVAEMQQEFPRNSEGVANALPWACGDATPSELFLETIGIYPGLPKPNPGLELANAFSVVRRLPSFTHPLPRGGTDDLMPLRHTSSTARGSAPASTKNEAHPV